MKIDLKELHQSVALSSPGTPRRALQTTAAESPRLKTALPNIRPENRPRCSFPEPESANPELESASVSK